MGWGARFGGVLVVGFVLAACGGGGAGPEPQVLSALAGPPPAAVQARGPTPVPTPSPTRERSAPVVELPEAAQEHTAVGAQAFARHFLGAYNAALATGDTTELEALSDPGCASCAAYVRQIRKAYDGGGSISGGDISVLSTSAPELRDGVPALVEMEAAVAKQRVLGAAGEVVASFPAERPTVVVYPRWRASRWVVAEIKIGVRE